MIIFSDPITWVLLGITTPFVLLFIVVAWAGRGRDDESIMGALILLLLPVGAWMAVVVTIIGSLLGY